jgi:hypothetical protein
VTAYENLTGMEIMPELTGPVLAGGIIATSFAYSFATHKKLDAKMSIKNINNIDQDDAKKNIDS